MRDWLFAFFLFSLLLQGCDAPLEPANPDEGVVIERVYTPQHIYYPPIVENEDQIPDPIVIPESYSVKIKLGRGNLEIAGEVFYRHLREGDQVLVYYSSKDGKLETVVRKALSIPGVEAEKS